MVGIMVPVSHFAGREFEEGRLLRLLQVWERKPQSIHPAWQPRRFVAPKLRAMIDFLAAEF